jgi:hypothetical protein
VAEAGIEVRVALGLLRSADDASLLEPDGEIDDDHRPRRLLQPGRKAQAARARPKTLVTKAARIKSAVSSAGVGIALPAGAGFRGREKPHQVVGQFDRGHGLIVFQATVVAKAV